MFEFLMILFVLYVMYKMAEVVLTILAAILMAVGYIVLFSAVVIATIVKVVVEQYAKAFRENSVITIGSTCALYAGYVVLTH